MCMRENAGGEHLTVTSGGRATFHPVAKVEREHARVTHTVRHRFHSAMTIVDL